MRLFSGLVAALAAAMLFIPAVHAVDIPEVEPNDGKAGATVANNGGLGLVTGDTISGTTTGASGSGAGSSDYFIVTTAAAAPGFYRHQLSLTSGTVGHTLTIRGLTQAAGVIGAGTDATFQTGITGYPGAPSPDARTVVWYGVGKAERIYIRVTGTISTSSSYSMQLTTSAVAPVPFAAAFAGGNLTIDRAAGNVTDTDFWVYDGALTAIATYGNDGPNRLTRPFAPGTYYVTYTNENFGNNLPSPIDDTNRAGTVLDFADAFATSNASSGDDLDISVKSAAGTFLASSTKTRPFDITVYCFTVIPSVFPTPPVGKGEAAPSEVENCQRGVVCMSVQVTPGSNPTSTGISVQVNLSSFGLGIQTMLDNGLGCDALPGDLTFTLQVPVPAGQSPGTYSFPFLVRDQQDRSSQGVIQLLVQSCGARPGNDLCTHARPILAGEALTGTTINATVDPGLRNCRGGDVTAPGVWYRTVGTGHRLTASLCSSANPYDSFLSVYCGSHGCDELDCIGGDDDTCDPLSRVSWCTEEGASYFILVHGFGTLRGEFLLELDDSGLPCSGALPCAPRGACCTADGCQVLTAEQCALRAGNYQGDGVECVNLSIQPRFASGNTFPISIPDNSPTGATSTILVPSGSGVVDRLVVGVGVRHTAASELTATLTHGATTVTLFFAEDGSADLNGGYAFTDFSTRFLSQGRGNPIEPGIYRSRGLLLTFDGQNFQGLWTLRLIDAAAGNTGQITGFSLGSATLSQACDLCPPCPADYNSDGGIDGGDVQAFFDDWQDGLPCADVNADGGVDGGDAQTFFELWENGSCG